MSQQSTTQSQTQNYSNPESVYNCSYCQVIFPTESLYKFHYKTDLHQYNLKRRILDLPPITEDQFNLQFNTNQSETSVHSNLLYCPPCGKSFSTKNTLNQHLLSKKHQEKAKTAQEKIIQTTQQNQRIQETESDTSASKQLEKKTANEDISICLFCNKKSGNFTSSLSHMKNAHGFYMQQEKFISNYKGLVKYLANKINVDKECINCEAIFKSEAAAQSHMIDKQHCFTQSLSSQQPEYLTFYDFTRKIEQFPKKQSCEVVQESKQENEDEEVKNDQKSEASSYSVMRRNSEDLQSNLSDWEVCEDSNIDLQKMELKKEEFVKYLQSLQQDIKITPGGEVQLSNGKILGHRAYRKYYQMYYTDFEEYNKRIQNKMIGDSDKNFKLRQQSNQLQVLDESAQQALEKQKKQEIKEKNINHPKNMHTLKEKRKLGSDHMNNRSYLVSGIKERV